MRSIRTFLVIVIVSVICLSNFFAALQGYRDSLNKIDQIEEQQLEEKLRELQALFNHRSKIPADLFGDDALFQIWHQGKLIAKSANVTETMFYGENSGFHLKSYLGHRWLTYRLDKQEESLHIIVATKHRVYLSLTEEALIRAIFPIIWVLPVIGILVWIIVNIGTKPLKKLAIKLSSKAANDFSPLKDKQYTKELLPIISALNGLFERLSDAFERERRFSADAAHELRTPLSALKINLHNLSAEEKGSEAWWALKRTADRMEHGIEQLLALHKASLDLDGRELVDIELHKVAQEVIAEMYDQLSNKKQNIELLGADVNIKGSLPSITVLLRNLVDNASKYTPEKGSIRVSVQQKNERACVLVEDSGPGIPDEEYARVLQRFYRVGGDRNESKVVGSGLGLSIVSDIVQRHNGQLYLSKSSSLGGLAVSAFFPLKNNIGVQYDGK